MCMSVKALSGQDKYVIGVGSDRESFAYTFGSSTVESVSLVNAVTPLFFAKSTEADGITSWGAGKGGEPPHNCQNPLAAPFTMITFLLSSPPRIARAKKFRAS
jgi:hypothetical protein